jgi:cell division septation protein DedD
VSWTRLRILVAILACAPSAILAADPMQEVRDLRRKLQYDDARAKLEIYLPDLEGDARAEGLLLQATLVDEARDARRILADAARAATSAGVRRKAVLEQAKLEYARGSYSTARTRLEAEAGDPEVDRWITLCAAGLGDAKAPGGKPATPDAAPATRYLVQLGAFEDRGNALRFRAGLPRDLGQTTIQELEGPRGRLYRVLTVGAFTARDAAEAWAAEHLGPHGLSWQVVTNEKGAAP